jgi:L-asparaginase II
MRGSLVESVHCGSVAVADTSGKIVFALGDLERPVYPRPSLKPIQALPLVESGSADAFGLGDEEVALACASHSGEPMHTTRVAAWLARIGCDESDLACGAYPTRYQPVAEDMIKRGEKPTTAPAAPQTPRWSPCWRSTACRVTTKQHGISCAPRSRTPSALSLGNGARGGSSSITRGAAATSTLKFSAGSWRRR